MQESQFNPEFHVDVDFDTVKKDWNKLMGVVLKIESLNHQKFGKFKVIISDDCCTIQATNRTKENTYNKTYCSKTKINSVYESVLLFLDWYNKIK